MLMWAAAAGTHTTEGEGQVAQGRERGRKSQVSELGVTMGCTEGVEVGGGRDL